MKIASDWTGSGEKTFHIFLDLEKNYQYDSCNINDLASSDEDPLVICNELLCYLYKKMDGIAHDILVKVCIDFYEPSAIDAAKTILFSCKL